MVLGPGGLGNRRSLPAMLVAAVTAVAPMARSDDLSQPDLAGHGWQSALPGDRSAMHRLPTLVGPGPP
jgi:hypothetical protein